MKRLFRKFMNDNKGIGVVEMVLILLVLVGLVIIFKSKAGTLIDNIFKNITTKVGLM